MCVRLRPVAGRKALLKVAEATRLVVWTASVRASMLCRTGGGLDRATIGVVQIGFCLRPVAAVLSVSESLARMNLELASPFAGQADDLGRPTARRTGRRLGERPGERRRRYRIARDVKRSRPPTRGPEPVAALPVVRLDLRGSLHMDLSRCSRSVRGGVRPWLWAGVRPCGSNHRCCLRHS